MAKSKVKIKNNNKLSKKLKKIEQDVSRGMLQEMAYDISFEISHAYEQAIDAFYAHYKDPEWYERTYSTYEAYKKINGYSGSGLMRHNRVGIRVSASYIRGNPYTSDKSKVFENTFVYGRHGYMNNAIKNKIAEKFNSEKRFSLDAHNPSMVRMNYSPKQIMDKWFDAFVKGEACYINTDVKDRMIKVKAKKDISDEAWEKVKKRVLG